MNAERRAGAFHRLSRPLCTDRAGVDCAASGALMIGCVPAYVDESGRTSGGGLYVMAAVVVPPNRAEDVRVALRAGLRRGQRRSHWRDENEASREALVNRLRALGLRGVVTTVSPVEPRKTERARRRCLVRLLWELERRRCREVIFESRQQSDRLDRQVIAAAQRARQISSDLRYTFARPESEPLLWLPDIVAGAVTRCLGDGDGSLVALLGESVET